MPRILGEILFWEGMIKIIVIASALLKEYLTFGAIPKALIALCDNLDLVIAHAPASQRTTFLRFWVKWLSLRVNGDSV